MWFRGTLTWSGPPGVDWNFFWLPRCPQQSGDTFAVITSPLNHQPGTTVTYGPWELQDTTQWHAIGGEGRTHNQVNYAVSWTEVFEYSDSSAGPWQFLSSNGFNETTTGNGWTSVDCASVDALFGGQPPCSYGTQLQTGAQLAYYITPGLVDVWLSAVEMPWLAPIFTGLWFTSINAETLCGGGPPSMPVIDMSTLEASYTTALQILRAIAWPSLCECKPGTPTPVPYPPPTQSQPTGWPAAPTFNCSNTDLCSMLLSLQQQIAGLQSTLGQELGLTTLIQRYHVPFAAIGGAAHSGLTGSGSFAISRLLGVQAAITGGLPGRALEGQPPYYWNAGWLSCTDGGGMLQEVRLTRAIQRWCPPGFEMATLLGYWLYPGVEVRIVELEAEP